MIDRARVLLAGCLVAAAGTGSPAQSPPAPMQLPVGAQAERTGFWTILTAPDSPPGAREPARGYNNELTFYAQLAGVSNAEAAKRMKAQEATRPEFERLMRTLRTKERGNYTDAELVHRPDWAYRIYFKRNPAATLAKYTRNPRFQARSARYTSAELERLTKPWINRLNSERLTTGYGMNARQGTADIDMVVSRAEFEAIARRRDWGAPPEIINLKFGDAPAGNPVDPAAKAGIRMFPQSDRNLGITNQAALSGRIILRDGCLRVVGHDRKEQLAYFGREVGLGLDRSGYLSLHRRGARAAHLGRIGEMFTWAGPIGIDEQAPMVAPLRERCGNAPLMHVGVPDSSALFNARYGLPRAPIAPPPPPPAKAKPGG